MRIVDLRERSVPISRFQDSSLPSGGLTTSAVALITDVVRDGRPVVGYGFASMGRFAQSGLIRERFAPRLLAAVDTLKSSRLGKTSGKAALYELPWYMVIGHPAAGKSSATRMPMVNTK